MWARKPYSLETSATEPILYRGRAFRAAKSYFQGTHRTIPPAETLKRIQPCLAIAGITRLAEIGGLDRIGIPVTLAIRPNSRTLCSSSGKGLTREAALVSGAMESIELFHAEEVLLPVVEVPYERLDPEARIPLARLPLARHSLFDVHRPLHFTRGWDLVHQRDVEVPVSLVEMGRRRPGLGRFSLLQASSTGLASGNHFLEAVSHALFEAIERDAASCREFAWLKRGGPPPERLRLESIEHPLVRDLLVQLDAADIDAILLDYTVDVGVPVYAGYVIDRLHSHFGVFGGYGAHLDPAVAMMRALTEAVQSRAVVIAGSRDDFFRHQFDRLKSAGREGYRALLELPPTGDARLRASEATPTLEGDVAILLERLKAVGLDQVIVLDLSRGDFPIHVVKVFVPGLEPHALYNYTPGPRALAFAAQGRARGQQ